jgi:hypothetical protein
MAAGWTKIPPVQAPEEDGGGFLGGLLAVALPVAGAIIGFGLGGPPGAAAISGMTAGQGAMIGAGIGHAAGGVARAALADSPARQDQLIQQGLAAGFSTLPYLAQAYDAHAAAQLPGGPIQPMPVSSGPPAGSLSLTGPANPPVTSQYYAPGTLGPGSEAIPAYTPDPSLMGQFAGTPLPGVGVPGFSPQQQLLLEQGSYEFGYPR